MFNNLYDAQELQSDLDKERFTLTLSKVTDENIHAVFEQFTKHEIVNKILADKVWFKLEDRTIALDCLEERLSQHNEIMLDVIRGATTVASQLEIMVCNEIDEVIADYEVQHAS